LGEIGACIQLGPNAFHAFDYLGVGDAARGMAVYIDNLRLMDAITGDEITRISLDEPFRTRFKNPYAWSIGAIFTGFSCKPALPMTGRIAH
jgi:2-polyprenyl-6-methoxyphenol hydroxylase-like FAD-dependent oxidoreductase